MESVRLKPFDFAQAVARAGLQTNGQPLGACACQALSRRAALRRR